MPRAFRLSPHLGLHGLAATEGLGLEVGMHLRWAFDPRVGFPAFGFELHRRDARGKYRRDCVRISSADLARLEEHRFIELEELVVRFRLQAVGPAVTTGLASNNLRRFDFEIPDARVLTDISVHEGTRFAFAIALRDGRVVAATHRTASDPRTMPFAPVVVDGLIVITAARGPSEVCFAEDLDPDTQEWSASVLPAPGAPEFGYGLPLTHDDHNLHHRFENASDPAVGDLEEARARVPDPLDEAGFGELRAGLSVMVDRGIPGRMFDREICEEAQDGSDEPLSVLERPLDWALAASVNPAMARVLGLYFVDRKVEPDKTYDYAIVGRWSGWQLDAAAKVYSFAAVPEGTYVPRRSSLCGAALHLPTGGRVRAMPSRTGPCRKALAVRGRHLFFTSSGPFSMRFNRPLRWVRVELGQRAQELLLAVRHGGAQVAARVVSAGQGPLTVDIDPDGPAFTELRIVGGDFDLFGVRTMDAGPGASSPAQLDEPVALGSVLLGMRFTKPAELDAPSPPRLRGVSLPIPAETDPPPSAAPQGLGLRWRPAPSTTAPLWPEGLGIPGPMDAAGFHVRYQHLGDAAGPAAVDPSKWVIPSTDPVVLAARPGEDEHAVRVRSGDDLCVLFPDVPARDEPDPGLIDGWLEPWVPVGWFAAGVRAVDVFGRTSAWADAPAEWIDNVTGPPPPIVVLAQLLEADDPALTPEERALVDAHGDGCIRVRWAWPAQFRRAAPTATHFRVYFHPRPFNRWRAEVRDAAITSVTEISCAVDVEEALDAGALVGGRLVDARAQSFAIIANAAGTSIALTLKRPVADPARTPQLGVGSVRVTAASPGHEDGGTPGSWTARVARAPVAAGETFEAVVSPVGFAATADEPVRYGQIGVTTADDSARHPDAFTQPAGPPWDPALGDQPGRQGRVSPPTSITSVYRTPPQTPEAVVRDRLFTSRPDFQGRARYTLRWPNVLAPQRGHTRWHVLRATDVAVLSLYELGPDDGGADASALPAAVRTELEAALAAGGARQLSDETVELLAAQPGARRAFIMATESPLTSLEDEVEFVDTVEAINRVRYLYRTRIEDTGGNLSPPGPPAQAVHVPPSQVPAPVAVTQCQGGERQVELQFRPNAEDDLAGYLLYSSEGGVDPASLAELRVLRRGSDASSGTVEAYDRDGHAVAPTLTLSRADADASLVDGFVSLARRGLPGGAVFHYRLVAFDSAGNPSVPTRVFAARTSGVDRPAAPTWGPVVRGADELQLSWTSPHDDLNCLVERSLDGGLTWKPATGWLGRGNYEAVVPGSESGAKYRLRVMFRNGQGNLDFDPLEVTA